MELRSQFMVVAVDLFNQGKTEIESSDRILVILGAEKGKGNVPDQNGSLINQFCIIEFFVDEHDFLHNS